MGEPTGKCSGWGVGSDPDGACPPSRAAGLAGRVDASGFGFRSFFTSGSGAAVGVGFVRAAYRDDRASFHARCSSDTGRFDTVRRIIHFAERDNDCGYCPDDFADE